jgi:hypothetical protein
LLHYYEAEFSPVTGDSATALAFCSCIVSMIVLFGTLNLIALHIYLNYKGMTTYEFVVRRRKPDIVKVVDESNGNVTKDVTPPMNDTPSNEPQLTKHNYETRREEHEESPTVF